MPRVKGSGKSRKPAARPGQPRRRGRKPKEPTEVALPAEQLTEQQATGEPASPLPAAQPAPDEERAPEREARDAQGTELVADEAALTSRYPHQRFKAGSLLPAGATAEFGTKRSIVILCQDCDAERRVATSDVFHTSRCVLCGKSAKKAARKAKREGEG
jgi:hypothetical protein